MLGRAHCNQRSTTSSVQRAWCLTRILLLAPERYIGRQVTIKGTLSYKNTERRSFDLKQGDDTIHVFYELLPQQEQALILREENFSDVPVTVRGAVQRFRNAENSDHITAAKEVILQSRPAAGVSRRPIQPKGRDSDVTFSAVPAQPKRPFQPPQWSGNQSARGWTEE